MVEIRGNKAWVDPKVINLVTRAEWGALPPKKEMDSMPLPINAVSFSCNTDQRNVCSTKEECVEVVRTLQKAHMDKGLPDIAYNFLIGDDNNVYEGRGWNLRPALYEEDPQKYGKTMDVAYIGIHEAKYIHYGMYESFLWLKDLGIEQNYLEPEYKEYDFCDKEEHFEIEEDDVDENENSPETPPVENTPST